MSTFVEYYLSPLGTIEIVCDEENVLEVEFVEEQSGNCPSDLTARVMRQLQDYFAGSLQEFDLPLAPAGTEFQKRVWKALQHLPYGTTTNYGKLAADLGDSNLSRAVGLANGKNPIAIIIPCHRVIGADGSLTGYAGGLPRKKALLQLEGSITQLDFFAQNAF